MIALFAAAFGIGLAFCAPPGAVTAEALRRGLAGGFWPVLLLELGSIIGDATWAAVALVGAAVLVQSEPVRLVLGAVGVIFLLRLAYGALRDAWEGAVPKARPMPGRGHFATGAVLSLTNPLAVAFWVSVGFGAVASLVPTPSPADFATFYAGFLAACLLWSFGFASIVAWGRQLLRPAFFRVVNLACGAALSYFAIRLLLSITRLA
jgi:chemosensory pili system protein ChpE